MSAKPRIEFEDADGRVYKLPARYQVCSRCEGSGSHVNPAIDGNGIAADDFYGPDWDDESREAYLTGRYDVRCEVCKGQRVVAVLDTSQCPPDLRERYEAVQRDLALCDSIQRAEQRAEAWAAGERD